MTFIRLQLRKLYDWSGTSRARKLILGLFIVQAVFLVFATNIGTPPDEDNHIEFVKYYAQNSLAPIFTDQEPTWSLGDKTREVDYLYHYLMSLVVRALPFSDQAEVYILRLISVAIVFVTFLLLIKLWKRLKIGGRAINVTLLALVNLPMVLMMSSAVNNDTLVWLGIVASLLLIVRLYQDPRPGDVVLLLLIAAYGGLVKRTMLPVIVAIVLVGGFLVLKRWKILKHRWRWSDWRIVAGLILLVAGAGLFIERVGGNLYTYGAIAPECEQIKGEEACKVFWLSARNEWLNNEEARETEEWLQGGARKDDHPMTLLAFIVSWLVVNVNNIVDIQAQGWRHVVMPPIWLGTMTGLVLILGLILGMVYDGRAAQRSGLARLRLLVIGLLFVVILAQFIVNYAAYQEDRVFGLALNGRYLLPAIIPLAGLASFYWTRILKPVWRGILATTVVGSIVVGSGIIMMIRNSQLFTG